MLGSGSNHGTSGLLGSRTTELPSVTAGTVCGPPRTSHLFCTTDRSSGPCFLVDTGAEVSVLLRKNPLPDSPSFSSQVANGTRIATYGERSLTRDIGLRRAFKWIFLLADAQTPIIGADFLTHYNLSVDVRHKRLLDTLTSLSVNGISAPTSSTGIRVILPDSHFADILRDFPNLTHPCQCTQPVTHSVVHHIQTRGPPVHANPRRLHPDKLQIAKHDFEHMLELGFIRPSSSHWPSPLNIVPKKSKGDWKPCGDYRSLNNAIIPYRCPIPRICDFASTLCHTNTSKLDLVRAYYHIPVAPNDIPKTDITTSFGLFEFTRMPFGLRNTAQTFQRFMDGGLLGILFVYAYLDDVLVASTSTTEHAAHLRAVFELIEAPTLLRYEWVYYKCSRCPPNQRKAMESGEAGKPSVFSNKKGPSRKRRGMLATPSTKRASYDVDEAQIPSTVCPVCLCASVFSGPQRNYSTADFNRQMNAPREEENAPHRRTGLGRENKRGKRFATILLRGEFLCVEASEEYGDIINDTPAIYTGAVHCKSESRKQHY
ncbi:hypothetical protein T265_10032 [Opisthorchis viverrini]|uniref:Reverse transcriptase domain-containing protein n=1 Tax=Opisthorchis viverrini TaxID=6198 RepID=A0A074ZEQ6_OPIVI|nr:hypothetical protein T265_10032 [Opisthorchis viverrini]KER21705.1 hypothetical protein T265_10032 [Opisthorchis viverrini]